MMPVTFDVPPIEPVSAIPFLIVCIFVVLDVVFGLSKAFATHSYDSSKMRSGLWHKSAIIGIVLLAYILQLVTALMDFSVIGIEAGTSIPITAAVTAYVVLMEVGSILESIVQINPELGGKGLMKHFSGFTLPDETTELPRIESDEE